MDELLQALTWLILLRLTGSVTIPVLTSWLSVSTICLDELHEDPFFKRGILFTRTLTIFAGTAS